MRYSTADVYLSAHCVQALLDKLNRQNQCNIKLPALLVALGSLPERGHHNVVSDKTGVSSSSASGEGEVSKAVSSDDNELLKIRRLSPDSTAGIVDWSHLPNSRYYRMKSEQTDDDVLAMTNVSELPEHGECRVAGKFDARALVRKVYYQLREAEQQSKMVSSLPPLLPAAMVETVVADAVPDCRLALDPALLELAAEARQIPAVGSEREALVMQVIRSVEDAHIKTCSYTRAEVDAGVQRYLQVCVHCTV